MKVLRSTLILVFLALAPACAHAPAPVPAGSTPGMAASPYTAEELRGATRAGRTFHFKLEKAGDAASFRETTFLAVDAEGAQLRATPLDEKGSPNGPAKESRATWEELRTHGEFPLAKVSRSEETVTVPAGTFDCVVYDVRGEDGIAQTTRYYFPKKLPGPPVLFYVEIAGKRVLTNTMVKHVTGS